MVGKSLSKNAQTMKDYFENILITSKRRPILIETDRGKEFCNIIFQNFLNNNNIQNYSRNTSFGSVFAERFNHSIRDLLKNPVFEWRDGNWIDILPTIRKQFNNRTHTCIKLPPIQASLRKNEGFVCKNLIDKRKKLKPKSHKNELVRTADLKKTF